VTPILELAGVSKAYGGLRPLRIRELTVSERDTIAVVGFDQASAEVLVNLVTGATLPDAGQVTAFGQSTRDVADSEAWLSLVDRFGIVSERAVLLDSLTVLQNLAMPFTLDIDPLEDAAQARAAALGATVGLTETQLRAPVAALDPAGRLRVRVARALALDPPILVLEHASGGLNAGEATTLGTELREIAARRALALLAVTADEVFAGAVAARVLRWEPATGRLTDRRGWFRSRLG
jgi:predicted ABC-type transport system involved in lysophospholipase L1 biosynthesis ATPase subunit